MILTRWSDFDRDLGRRSAALDEIRRHMDDVMRQFGPGGSPGGEADVATTYPRANLYDDGTSLVLYAAVPGMSADDLENHGPRRRARRVGLAHRRGPRGLLGPPS